MAKISDRIRALLVGIFIITAYGILVSGATQERSIVMVADVLSGLSVIAIAVLMYPLFKTSNKNLAASYVVLKFGEGLLMLAAGLFFLNSATEHYRTAIYEGVQVYAFIASAFLFYYLLYVSQLVPRFISVWGVLGITALLVSTLLKLANIDLPFISYFLILIITNEFFLALWLILKGFSKRPKQ
jgi:hypothetical protein